MALLPLSATALPDEVVFAKWIHAKQFPRDCTATTGYVTRQDYFFSLGLGAQMVALKFGLLNALLAERVYHFPTTHYVNPLRCPSRSFNCYFELPTNCTARGEGCAGESCDGPPASRHAKTESVKIHWCFDLPRRRLSRLAGLASVHALDWYNAQLAGFLFRPNAAMREYRRWLLPRMDRSDPFSNTSRAMAAAAREAGKTTGPRLRGRGPKKEASKKQKKGAGRRLEVADEADEAEMAGQVPAGRALEEDDDGDVVRTFFKSSEGASSIA